MYLFQIALEIIQLPIQDKHIDKVWNKSCVWFYHTRLHNAGAHFCVILNDWMLFK